MKNITFLLMTAMLFLCAGCDGTPSGEAHGGGGSDNNRYGRVTIGLPF